jgi:seryl-tRNA synthetase
MIDIKVLRENINGVEQSLSRRGYTLDKDKFVGLDTKRKSLQVEVETLQSDRKSLSNDFGKLKASGENTHNLKNKLDIINNN